MPPFLTSYSYSCSGSKTPSTHGARARVRRKTTALLLVILSTLACTALLHADDAPPPPATPRKAPHNVHEDTIDEPPHRAAVFIPGTGNIDFPISTTSPEAQKFFNQGVGQLHGFAYYEAERSFRQVALLDKSCAMAAWGMAMANFINARRAAEFSKQALKLRDKASPREQLYLDALSEFCADPKLDEKVRRTALIKSMEKLIAAFPDDLEAKAFLVFHQWDNEQHDLPIESRSAVATLAGEVLAKSPEHPGAHHYLIHLWNHKDDQQALKDAAVCAKSAPAIAHLWHMPGHTFSALHRYADAAWQQEASLRVDHRQMIAAHLLPTQIHDYAHNSDWLVENLGYLGRIREATTLAKNMIELPRRAPRPRQKDDAKAGYVKGEKRLIQLLLGWGHWEELLALEGTGYLAPFTDFVDEAGRRRALAVAAFQKSDTVRGEAQVKALGETLLAAKADRITKAEAAETKARKELLNPEQVAKAMVDALLPLNEDLTKIEKLLAEAKAYQALAAGQADEARTQLASAGEINLVRLSRFHQKLGGANEADEKARRAVKEGEGEVLPLANLADLLWRTDRKSEAIEVFHKLRPLCAQADLGEPALTRLKPIADELKLPADWRPKLEWPADSGERPDLQSLGPLTWHPSPAPDWSLVDQNGKTRTLAEFKGKPVIVMFYLGSGCSHCVEQLNTFEPLTKDFTDAGIQLLAVSKESAEDLRPLFAQTKNQTAFPFPILSDATHQSFKAYGAFDDFDNAPVHGIYLIDGAGLIRWQEISNSAFTQAKWLLTESQRLLATPVTLPGATAPSVTASDNP